MEDDIDVDGIIEKLLEAKNGQPVRLPESDISGLCSKAIEIFISQPILLELEAPIKIAVFYVGFTF